MLAFRENFYKKPIDYYRDFFLADSIVSRSLYKELHCREMISL